MIEFKDVSFSYESGPDSDSGPSPDPGAPKTLESVSFRIETGECVVLCGESGCGKTTITRLINGLIPHHYEGTVEGSVVVDGQEIAEQSLAKISHTIGSVFQNPRSQFFNVDTTDELAFGCENQALPVAEIFSRISESARLFDLDELLDRSIFELSGGEKQRIACASAYATHPDIIVFDEPSSNLDVESIELLRRTIALLKQAGKTIVVSEHRLHFLKDIADRYFYIRAGKLERVLSAAEMNALSPPSLADMGLRALDLAYLGQNALVADAPSARLRGGEAAREADAGAREADAGAKEANAAAPLYGTPYLRFVDLLCRHQEKTALTIDQACFDAQEIVAVIGHNGAGKSTFAQCLCGLTKHSGAIEICGRIAKPKQRIAKSYMVMQDVNHQLFTESVLDEVSLNIPDDAQALVEASLEELGLSYLGDSHPLALSGGQKQRVAIASALCSGKEILVYDEPTSGLDYRGMRASSRLIKQAAQRCALTFIITHDLELILQCCTSVLHLDQGRIRDQYPLCGSGTAKVTDYFLSPPKT